MPTKDPKKLRAIRRRYYERHKHEKKIRAVSKPAKSKAASPEASESARRMLARATEMARYGYSGKLTPGGF
jgi:hypothetical protein